MRTDKQREASRLNALKSTGPRTPEGKAISSRNSFKLGICVSDGSFYLDPESREQLQTLLTEYEQHYKPGSPFERDALKEIALCTVRLDRIHRVEEGLYAEGKEKAYVTHTITKANGQVVRRFEMSIYPPEERPTMETIHLAAAWRPSNDLFETLTRQETRISHRLRRAHLRFAELQKARKNEPEPISEPEPDQLKNEATPGVTPVVSEKTSTGNPPVSQGSPAVPVPAEPAPASPELPPSAKPAQPAPKDPNQEVA